MTLSAIEEGYALALKKLTASDYSAQEMLEWLKRRGCAAKDAQAVIELLLERNYIDDDKLCARLCEAWRRDGLYGKKLLMVKLLKRKLPAPLIEARLALTEADETEKARAVLKIYLRKMKKNDATAWQKSLRYLAARGFSYETARQATEDSNNN